MIKKIYQFKDVLTLLESYPDISVNSESFSFLFKDAWTWLKNVAESIGISEPRTNLLLSRIKGTTYDEELDSWSFSDEGKAIINSVIERYYDWYCFEILVNPLADSDSEINKKTMQFFTQFINVYNNTYDKYVSLLSNLANLKNSLISGKDNSFHSETDTTGNGLNRFNDTPQNSGTFDDDMHTTNLTETETSGNSETTGNNVNNDLYNVEKLELLNRKYQNVMLDWSNEFRRLFYMEVC